MFHDQSFDGFGSLAKEILESHVECVEVVRYLFASDLVSLFDALVDCVSNDFA